MYASYVPELLVDANIFIIVTSGVCRLVVQEFRESRIEHPVVQCSLRYFYDRPIGHITIDVSFGEAPVTVTF